MKHNGNIRKGNVKLQVTSTYLFFKKHNEISFRSLNEIPENENEFNNTVMNDHLPRETSFESCVRWFKFAGLYFTVLHIYNVHVVNDAI